MPQNRISSQVPDWFIFEWSLNMVRALIVKTRCSGWGSWTLKKGWSLKYDGYLICSLRFHNHTRNGVFYNIYVGVRGCSHSPDIAKSPTNWPRSCTFWTVGDLDFRRISHLHLYIVLLPCTDPFLHWIFRTHAFYNAITTPIKIRIVSTSTLQPWSAVWVWREMY